MLYSAQETLQFFKNLLHIITKQNDLSSNKFISVYNLNLFSNEQQFWTW
jgi:hypothetical protein